MKKGFSLMSSPPLGVSTLIGRLKFGKAEEPRLQDAISRLHPLLPLMTPPSIQ